MHHRRACEEMSDYRPPVGEIRRLLEADGVVFQRLPPHYQDKSVRLFDAAAQFQPVTALRLLDELPPLRKTRQELVGLSGMDTETYPVSAQALESTSVCEIPFDRLEDLSMQLPQLRRQLMRIMSREIRDDQQMMLLLSKKTADERIAAFLVNLSARFRARGFSASHFRLSMSRNELGNYLGLAVETVSRVFTRFQQNGLIDAEGKEVHILKSIELCSLAGGNLEL